MVYKFLFRHCHPCPFLYRLGEWVAVQKCPQGNMVSFSLTIELPQPLIPHAVSNLEVLCSGGAKVKKDIFQRMEEGKMSKRCPRGFICGIQTRVANENQMLGKVELRDVKMFCCDWSTTLLHSPLPLATEDDRVEWWCLPGLLTAELLLLAGSERGKSLGSLVWCKHTGRANPVLLLVCLHCADCFSFCPSL